MAVGAVARSLLKVFDILLYSYVETIGPVAAAPQDPVLVIADYDVIENSPVRCADPETARQMMKAIDEAKAAGDSLGGTFVVVAVGVPVGLGSHVQWDRKLDARLAAALMSVQAIKGVEIGGGFSLAARPGSQVHDEIFYHHSKGYYRHTNHAGGIEGGISNGEAIVCRAAMKPIPTLSRPLQSVNMEDHSPYTAAVERADELAYRQQPW